MRCREVWVHAVDLDVGVGFGDIPDHVLAALVDDVTRTWRRRGETPDVRFVSGARTWGSGSRTARGELPALAASLTGRQRPETLAADGPLPALPRWL
jgi:maleylpyruvate isomerase